MVLQTKTTTPLLSVSDQGTVLLDGAEMFSADLTSVLDRLGDMVQAGTKSLVVTPNVDQVVLMANDDAARTIVTGADLRLIDGMPVAMLARLLGAKDVHRNTGADLLEQCVKESARRNWSIAIIGGSSEALGQAVDNLRLRYTEAQVYAVNLPKLDDVDDMRSVRSIQALADINPDLVFVCMGFPRQESWYHHWKETLPISVYLGVGAAVDFAAGSKKRAPIFLQRAGLEWLFRFIQEPHRLAERYLLRDPQFIFVAARSIAVQLRTKLHPRRRP
jgi:N-acetylglucosaminyldiphosphoundecaprenol N-acetyl-beta-D-mannosaminyltransferase